MDNPDCSCKLTRVRQDPTLQTTNLNTSSAVQCVISHWGAGYGVLLVQAADPSNRSRYSNKSSPIIEFHGDKDTTVPFADALAVEAAYKQVNRSGNLAYEMHVLSGDGHAAWCAGCTNADPHGKCAAKGTWCHAQDTAALPFVAQHLNLDLDGTPPPPSPPPPPPPPAEGCVAATGTSGPIYDVIVMVDHLLSATACIAATVLLSIGGVVYLL